MKRLNPYSGLVGGLSDGAAHSIPRSRQYFVKAPYLGSAASGCRSSRNSCMAFFVTPGIAALLSITSLNSSNALPLSRLRSSTSSEKSRLGPLSAPRGDLNAISLQGDTNGRFG